MEEVGVCVALSMLLVSGVGAAYGADQKIVSMLGGTYCDLYFGEVESVLKKQAGVKAVDFKSMRGHAVVTLEGGKTMLKQLTQAVNGVREMDGTAVPRR